MRQSCKSDSHLTGGQNLHRYVLSGAIFSIVHASSIQKQKFETHCALGGMRGYRYPAKPFLLPHASGIRPAVLRISVFGCIFLYPGMNHGSQTHESWLFGGSSSWIEILHHHCFLVLMMSRWMIFLTWVGWLAQQDPPLSGAKTETHIPNDRQTFDFATGARASRHVQNNNTR